MQIQAASIVEYILLYKFELSSPFLFLIPTYARPPAQDELCRWSDYFIKPVTFTQAAFIYGPAR